MSELVEVWRGSVTAAECDSLGHMNVRHYIQRSTDAVAGLALELGFGPRRLDAMQMCFVVREHHVRFHAELLPGTACVIRSGVVEVADERLRVYQELVRVSDAAVSATFLVDVEYAKENGWRPEPLSGELRARASNQLVTLPDYARPRGMELDPPRPTPTPEEADDLGLMETFRGVVPRQDTDLMCRMTVPAFMGCFSAAAPNFFLELGEMQLDPSARSAAALLEARLVYRNSPILGDVLVARTGLKAQRGTTTHFCHWMFHEETGECLCSTEFVAAMLDLDARKLLAPSREAVARIRAGALASLSP